MGYIARLLSFARRVGANISDVKVNPDGGSNVTAEHMADAGDDAYPLPSDYVAVVEIRGAGRGAVVGYADLINEPQASPGEKRVYGRDASSGEAVNQLFLKSDGSIVVDNENGAIEIKADGEILASNDGGSMSLKPSGVLDINTAVSVNIISPDVQLGALGGEELVKKSFLFSIFNAHVHASSPPPTPQATAAQHTINTKAV